MNPIKLLLFLLLAIFPFSLDAQPSGTQPQPQNCQSGCLACSSSQVCTTCDTNRVLEDGKCRCGPPRILRGNNCECPWYMNENSTTHNCEYIDLIDVSYQSNVSPFFDVLLQVQMNPRLKWTAPPTFTWTMDCNYQSADTKDQLLVYLLTQKSDFLRIPAELSLLEENLRCSVKVSYHNQNSIEIYKEFFFNTMNTIQPQIQIIGGPFQMLTHTETNVILAVTDTGPWSPTIEWTQLSGDTLDMRQMQSSSNPLKLTIPKCTLSPGKSYKFRVAAQYGTNPLLSVQVVTFGVYAPKIYLQSIATDFYHIYNQDLTLTASQFSVQDECKQGLSPVQFLDMFGLEYTWECAIVDLSANRLLALESTGITNDTNVVLHPDPLNLFYTSKSIDKLTIPSSYFTPYQNNNYQFIFYLTTTVPSKTKIPSIKDFNLNKPTLNVIQQKAYVQIVTSKPFTTVALSCQNENNCQSFSDDSTQVTALNYDPKLTYTWTIKQMPDNSYSIQAYNNWLTIPYVAQNLNTVPQIILQVTDGTNTASSFFTLPLQTPIQTGSLYIYPATGASYTTNFFVSTYLNKDDDLPISYQFYSNCYMKIALQKYEPFDYTPLLLPPGRGKCNIGVQMTDSTGHSVDITKSMLTLTGRATSLSDAFSKCSALMDASKGSPNIYQRARVISLVLENLRAWEISSADLTLTDTISQFKYSAISELKDIFLSLNQRDDIKLLMLNNLEYATNPLFNQDNNWKLYMSILDDYYQAESIIDPAFSLAFAVILDNLIYYMKTPGNGILDPKKILTYTNALIRSGLTDVLPTQNDQADGFISDGTFFYISLKKTTYCQALLGSPVLFYFGLQVTFTLRPGKVLTPEECNRPADFVFVAFRPKYTVADEDLGTSRSLIFVDLRDSGTGESLLDIFDFSIFSYIAFCPDDPVVCVKDDSGSSTITGTFDLRNQTYRAFGKTYIAPSTPGNNPEQHGNSTIIRAEAILKSVAFWTVIVATLLFVITFSWLYIKKSSYRALKPDKKTSLFKKTGLLFWLVHPFTGIFLYNDVKTTKATRLAIYYQRLVTVMVCSSVFSLISEQEETVSRALIILFNILVTVPINSILKRILSWIFDIKPSKKRSLKQAFAILFYLSLLTACIAVIVIIEAREDESSLWSRNWGINFAISFLQDIALTPIISIITKTLIIKSSSQGKPSKLKAFFLQSFEPIYTSIFQNMPTPIETQAPTPTEIVSPISTSRKLLKIPALESESPTLPSPTRVFRKRRASGSAMTNADPLPAETLTTDRFQTIFGEGKTERIKEESPINFNFERMPSVNIASAKFASSEKLAIPRDFNTKERRKLVNLASIMLSPTSPLSESAADIGPEEDGLFSSIGSPRENSGPKLLKENIERSTAEEIKTTI